MPGLLWGKGHERSLRVCKAGGRSLGAAGAQSGSEKSDMIWLVLELNPSTPRKMTWLFLKKLSIELPCGPAVFAPKDWKQGAEQVFARSRSRQRHSQPSDSPSVDEWGQNVAGAA